MATKRSKPVPGHKCAGARVFHHVNCECGWSSGNWGSRKDAYAEFRQHAEEHAKFIASGEKHDNYLSVSGGMWRIFQRGEQFGGAQRETTARDTARRFNIDVSHGRIWNGDRGAWMDDGVRS